MLLRCELSLLFRIFSYTLHSISLYTIAYANSLSLALSVSSLASDMHEIISKHIMRCFHSDCRLITIVMMLCDQNVLFILTKSRVFVCYSIENLHSRNMTRRSFELFACVCSATTSRLDFIAVKKIQGYACRLVSRLQGDWISNIHRNRLDNYKIFDMLTKDTAIFKWKIDDKHVIAKSNQFHQKFRNTEVREWTGWLIFGGNEPRENIAIERCGNEKKNRTHKIEWKIRMNGLKLMTVNALKTWATANSN